MLITTYTNRGAEAVRKEIKSQNCGVMHPLIAVKTWYSFMMSELIKPYQRFLTGEINGIKGFDYTQAYGHINYAKTGMKKRYITENKNVRSNEAASLVCMLNRLSDGKVIRRLEEIYSTIYFDEIQDMAGDDIEIIQLLIVSSINVVFCGDNKQATFSTHNTRKYKQQTGKNVWQFFMDMERKKLVEVERNLVSRRFNRQICCFANRVFPIGNAITTIMAEETIHDGVFLISETDIDKYVSSYSPRLLRYNRGSKDYGYFATNFGACKGETYDRVLIVPNDPLKKFILKGTALSSPEKYYVAVTRAKYSIAIVFDHLPKVLCDYEETLIDCSGTYIRALKFVVDSI